MTSFSYKNFFAGAAKLGPVDFLRTYNFCMIAPKRRESLIPILIGATMKKEYVNKETSSKIFRFLKGQKGIYICSEKNCKQFIEAVFWMSLAGA